MQLDAFPHHGTFCISVSWSITHFPIMLFYAFPCHATLCFYSHAALCISLSSNFMHTPLTQLYALPCHAILCIFLPCNFMYFPVMQLYVYPCHANGCISLSCNFPNIFFKDPINPGRWRIKTQLTRVHSHSSNEEKHNWLEFVVIVQLTVNTTDWSS